MIDNYSCKMRYILTIGFYLIINFSFSQSNTDLYNLGVDFFNKEKYKEADSVFSFMIKNGIYDIDVYFNRAAARNKLGNACGFCSDIILAASCGDMEANKIFWESCRSKDSVITCTPGIQITINDTSATLKNYNYFNNLMEISTINQHTGFATSLFLDRITKDTCAIVINDSCFSFMNVTNLPDFPYGGDSGLMKFLAARTTYPMDEKSRGIQGKVYVQFIIEKDGSVSNVDIYKGVINGPNLSEEALRVIKLLPKWIPGYYYGKPVRTKFILPLSFRLQ